MNKTGYILSFLLFILVGATGYAQCDSTAAHADAYLTKHFVSDGQSYRALLFDDQIAEFSTTFYGGSTYRIIGFAGDNSEQLHFSLFDTEGNELFTNKEHNNAPYWDFKFKGTMEGRIEAKLDLSKQNSACAVLLIGFER